MHKTIPFPKPKMPYGRLYENNSQLEVHLILVEDNQRAADVIVKATQDRCKHPTFELDYSSKNVLDSKTCTECGFKPKHPGGMHWQNCTNCWSPMEGTGVSRNGHDKYYNYKCTNQECGHTTSHT